MEQESKKEKDFVPKRSSQQIMERLKALNKLIKDHDIWMQSGYGKVPEPESRRVRKILEGKLLELRWLLGEDIDMMEGVY